LLGQSDLFATFGASKAQAEKGAPSKPPPSPSKRRDRAAADEEVSEEISTIRLVKQPTCIKFGEMRPYQLEGVRSSAAHHLLLLFLWSHRSKICLSCFYEIVKHDRIPH